MGSETQAKEVGTVNPVLQCMKPCPKRPCALEEGQPGCKKSQGEGTEAGTCWM